MFRHTKKIIIIAAFFAGCCLLPLTPVSGQSVSKRPLTHDDYDAWKSIVRQQLSENGKWLLYIEAPQEGEGELVVKNLETKKEFRHAVGFTGEGTAAQNAARPQLSTDTSHVVFLISPSKKEIDESKKDKKKKTPKKQLGILSLETGKTAIVENVKSFQMPENASGWVAYLKETVPEEKKEEPKKKPAAKPQTEAKKAPAKAKAKQEAKEGEEKKKEKPKKYGTPFVVRNLESGDETTIASVMSYHFTKNGEHIFYVVSDKKNSEKDGLYRLQPGAREGTALLSGKGNYKGLAFDKNETKLAFLTDRDDYASEESTLNLYGCLVGAARADLWVSHTQTEGIPEGMAVSDKSGISFSDDGMVMLFGLKEIPEPKKDEEEEDESEAKFDLWHWQDPYPQPQQKLMASRVRNNTWETVFHFDTGKLVKLADEDVPDVELSNDGKLAFARNEWPYAKRVSYDSAYYDVYIIDPRTGARTLVIKELSARASLSPGSKYVTWFDSKDWLVYNIATKTTTNVTESLNIRFDQEDHDRPEPPNAYGLAGWTKGDRSLLVYDHFDIWEILPDGSDARMITEGFGRKNHLSFRIVRTSAGAGGGRFFRGGGRNEPYDPKEALLLSATNTDSFDEGFFQDRIEGRQSPKELIMESAGFSSPVKAKNAEVYLFTRQSFEEYPDIWTSDLLFKNPKKITNLGRQMEPYLWGKAELRDFSSSDGKPLKGILIKPENFDPSRKYPLMLYIYETLHTGYHRFSHPRPGSSINDAFYVSNGYVIWKPDIEYGTGYPGRDALKCVLPGIQMLVREGYIDPQKIGIQGHSWGGYQIAYMVTQTNIFAAVEAGAPVSNMTSAYGGIRWASGMVRQFQYEKTQSRLGGSLWEVPLRYIENSPLFWADRVQTPILMMHNDKDGAVPWYQGIEYMMGLRRLGKEAYMFNYNGEAHGLRKRVNMKDYTIRMYDFFAHFLKDAPAPDWMKKGIKAWEKDIK